MFLVVSSKGAGYISPLARNPGKLSTSIAGQKTQEITNLLKSLHVDYSKVSSLDMTTFEVILPDGGKVILTSQKDLSQQVSSLQLIIGRLTMEGKHFSRLDFRYAKPVIVLR